MRKVLIISYYYEQNEFVGSIRIQGLTKYLDRFGWTSTVLTVMSDPNARQRSDVIRTPIDPADSFFPKLFKIDPNTPFKDQLDTSASNKITSFLKCALKIYKDVIYYPDEQKGWRSYAVTAGSKELEQGHYDAILSSAMPYTSHIVARDLKQRYGLPWVADFRDLWTQNHIFERSTVRKLFETRLEKRVISLADVITTVSEPLAHKLSSLHENIPIYSIPNGFDPDHLNKMYPTSTSFNILYTGTIYNKKQDPEPLFIALRYLIDNMLVDPFAFRVDIYGYHDVWVSDQISEYNLNNIVFLHDKITRDVSLNLQRNAQVLLLLAWNDPSEKGIYTGKIFDYLAAQRPILSIGGKGSVIEDLLLQTGAGINLEDPLEISNCLLSWYNDYLSSGCVKYRGRISDIQKYSHIEMAKKFAVVLDNVVKK